MVIIVRMHTTLMMIMIGHDWPIYHDGINGHDGWERLGGWLVAQKLIDGC